MRTRSKLELAKRCFWFCLALLGLWSLGLFKIALIVSVPVIFLLWIVGTFIGKTAPEQQFTINPFHPPSKWEDVHDMVWDMFMTGSSDKDEVVVARFLHHINAIADEQQPLFREADRAIYSKMTYEHQRKYGSLKYTYSNWSARHHRTRNATSIVRRGAHSFYSILPRTIH